jgi:hypothetical protein
MPSHIALSNSGRTTSRAGHIWRTAASECPARNRPDSAKFGTAWDGMMIMSSFAATQGDTLIECTRRVARKNFIELSCCSAHSKKENAP